MIDFLDLPLDEKVLRNLNKVKTDYVFQPVFKIGSSVPVAYEALMRPRKLTPELLLDVYTLQGDLHTVELATFYGAMLAVREKNIKSIIGINSFANVCLSYVEVEKFHEIFPEAKNQIVIELLKNSKVIPQQWMIKRKQFEDYGINTFIMDDFGTGQNDMEAVEILKPQIVKIDRLIIENIHKDTAKQHKFNSLTNLFHERGIKVVAEGVETKDEYEYIKSTAVDYLQGFYLGRPEG